MPNTLGIIYPEYIGILWYLWGWKCLFPRVSEMKLTLGIIYHKILQQLWGNVSAFQTDLRCQWYLEKLYMGSRVHPKKDWVQKTRTTLWITSGNNYRKSHKKLGRVCNPDFHGWWYICFVYCFLWMKGGSRMCWVVWEKAAGSILVFAGGIWT